MKKIFTLCLIIINFSLFAQPSLLSTEMATPGTIFTYKHVGTFTAIDTSIQGASQTWDFSTVTTTLDPDYVNEIIDPSQTPFIDSFPTANWCILEDGTDYNFYHLTSSLMERIGGYNSSDGYTYYSNTQIEYLFPMALGVNSSDLSTSVHGGSSSNGTYSFECIGYGTLITPNHTYNDVIFTRVILDVSIFHVLSYFWYDSDNGMPVFDYVPGDGGFIPEAAIYLNSVTNGIDDKNFTSGIRFNNPVTTMLDLRINSENPSDISYTLLNSLGEIVTNGSIAKSSHQQLQLNMEADATGIYFLKLSDINSPEKNRFVKIIKQ